MTQQPVANPTKVRVRFRKIRLNVAGYDAAGQYWGVGLPLYRFYRVDPQGDETTIICEMRAIDRVDARERFVIYARGRAMGNVEFVR